MGKFNFTLWYLPGGKNLLADALSCLPQYKSSREELVNSIIPSGQLAVQGSMRPILLALPQPANNEVTQKLREALEGDEWFRNHKADMMMKEGLAWKGSKLYVSLNLRAQILQRCHDMKPEGHFGFVKTLHWPGGNFGGPRGTRT
ncbi:hypothetical protein NXF25_019071 [Crotalus adamanteus]|uniref:Reverse transcriptase/retrotransposon-derived protein RNase H-like domain-containing protein n=1 Tax=Crotalus adamanteus TaxID=8729 RepID=A0AAW1B1M3_CROAD